MDEQKSLDFTVDRVGPALQGGALEDRELRSGVGGTGGTPARTQASV